MTDVARTWLTLDQGNSCLDAVLFGPEAQVLGAWRDIAIAELEQALAVHGQPCVTALSSVRGAQAEAELKRTVEAVLGPVQVPECGLSVQVDEPGKVGRDRLFAARAADALGGGRAAVVVDVGTAMTVDLVRGGCFLGGAIAPGPGLLARALDEGGAQLFEVKAKPGAEALGKNTREALEAGVVVGLRGAARALVEGLLAHEPDAVVFVTGGARSLLLEQACCLPGEVVVEVPLLVHLGLLSAVAHGSVGPDLIDGGFGVRHG